MNGRVSGPTAMKRISPITTQGIRAHADRDPIGATVGTWFSVGMEKPVPST